MISVNGIQFSCECCRHDHVQAALWQVAILTAAGASPPRPRRTRPMFYWRTTDPGYYRPECRPASAQAAEAQPAVSQDGGREKETDAKPQGPLDHRRSRSIGRRSASTTPTALFAACPVSTGMKGHSTPMGVFSVIQKHKMHHSNIYSGAPMPYMQRITWSGIAMHAGVLPGYPASHGCIRMPMAFAVKMWNWTRMGARVIVTPGQMTPQNFSHPMLGAVRRAAAAHRHRAGERARDKGDKGARRRATKVSEASPWRRKPPATDGRSLELRSRRTTP